MGGGGRYEPPRKRTKGGGNFAARLNSGPGVIGGDAPSRSALPARAPRTGSFGRGEGRGASRFSSSRPSFGGGAGRSGGYGASRTGAFGGARNGERGGFGGQSRGRNNRNPGENIDVTRFVNRSVTVAEEKAYLPTNQFNDFNIDERLKKNIAQKGYVIPTAIQDQCIPSVLKGSDMIGIANTGEGKTAAFLIPLINKMLLHPTAKVLVVVPTRELALQIDEEFMGFSRGLGIYSVLLVGGVSINMQIERLRRKVRMVIGTPGRLRDLIERRELNLAEYQNLVLDEADRMLDMGFINDIKYLIERLPKERHTLFFSATFSREIELLAKPLLVDPIRVSVKKQDTAKNVEQDIVRVRDKTEKYEKLCELLRQPGFGKVLVFGRTKHGVEKLSQSLFRDGFKSASIHGNKSQPQRQRALKDFKDDRVQILVATDVAARGLDIPNVTHVINYEVPSSFEDYVHRIGRTGRAGKKGNALTFVEGK
jgi:superfamily II DNA/RNA helicase